MTLTESVLEDEGMHVFEWWGGEYRPLAELIAEIDLTDAALEYAVETPSPPVDKELYMEQDADVMNMTIYFFDN